MPKDVNAALSLGKAVAREDEGTLDGDRGPAMTQRLILVILATLSLASCGESEAPIGRWEGFSESQNWLIAVRLEMQKNNEMKASALSAFVGDVELPQRHAFETELRDGMKSQWKDVTRTDVAFHANTITQKKGYAPLFVYQADSNSMVFHFYAGGKLTEKVTLRPVAAFSK